MTQIKLYSSMVCPFAHRSRLALLEKGIPFESIEIDLQNKPVNFSEISPYGKVPVLIHDDNRVWESAIVNEYLEETFPEPPLLPIDPLHRAQARIWINFADTRLFATTSKLLYGRDPQPPTALLQELNEHLIFMEREGLSKISVGVASQNENREPYWLGAQLSLVDLTFYPWFEHVQVLERFRGFEMPPGLDRLQQWHATVSQRKSVKSIANSPEFYLEYYRRRTQKI